MKSNNVRNSNIEVLRFFLMTLILIWHIIVHGFDFLHVGTANFVYTGNMPITLSIAVFAVPATYCFVFISGYFGINFQIKKFIELILWCICISVIHMLYQKYYLGSKVMTIDIIKSFFPITTRQWWFMTAYVMLYIISPLLNSGMSALVRKNQIVILSLLFLFLFTHMVIGEYNAGSSFEGLIFVYLLGRFFKEQETANLKNSIRYYVYAYIFMLLILYGIYYGTNFFNLVNVQRLLMIFMGFINPLIVMMAICIFFAVLHMPIWKNEKVNKILSTNLFIYLITEIDGGGIYRILANLISKNIILGVFFILITLICCLLIGHIIQFIVNRIVKIVTLMWNNLWRRSIE